MNKATLFLPDGSLTLLAARPDMGQRALAVTIARKLQQGTPARQVLYFSLALARKMLYCECCIPPDSQLCVIDHCFCIEEIYAIAQLLKIYGSLGFIAVDELALLTSRDSELAASSHDSFEQREYKRIQTLHHCLARLKSLARELNVPVLVLAQLSHHVEQREDPHPVIRDLRSCQIAEQDPDQIWLLYRDAYYDSRKDPEQSELIIAKNRFGTLGTVPLSYGERGLCSWFSGFDACYD